jgi:uncharacterized short protein YbdD (DUF466 family)
VQFVVEGRNGSTNVKCYQQYLDHLVQQHITSDPVTVESFFNQGEAPARWLSQRSLQLELHM